MKSKHLLIACFIAFAIPGSYLALGQSATSSSTSQDASAPQTTGGWPTPEQVVARMSSKLNLTDDQKSKITPIIADRQSQMKALMADNSGRGFRKARKAKSIMSDSDKKIEAVLTSDQKQAYEQMREENREQFRERMQQRNNPQQ